MNRAFPEANIEGHEHLIHELILPDPNDRHILAAAISCRASHIVTFNTKDFAVQELIPTIHSLPLKALRTPCGTCCGTLAATGR